MEKIKSVLLYSLICLSCISCTNPEWIYQTPFDVFGAQIQIDESSANTFLSVAAASINPPKENKSDCINQIEDMIVRIQNNHPGIQLVIFGEMTLGWYYDPDEEKAYIQRIAETIPGPSSNEIMNICQTYDVNIGYGLAEIDSGIYYNSYVLQKADGTYVKYRKRLINQTDIRNGISAGTEMVTVDIDGLKIALMICSDLHSETVSKEVARSDADLVAIGLVYKFNLSTTINTVARQLGKWVIYGNVYGQQDPYSQFGDVSISNPVGTILEYACANNAYVFRKIGFSK